MNKEQLFSHVLLEASKVNQEQLAKRMKLLPIGLEILLQRMNTGYRNFEDLEELANALNYKIDFKLGKVCR